MATIAAYARPWRLYRFRKISDETLKQELSAIKDGYIFCPNFEELNDPMEGRHRESAMLREARDYDATIARVRDAMKEFGVGSLSEVYNHEPMWAHYAGKFTGICVAYSFRRLLAGLPADNELIRMNYSEKAPVLLKNQTGIGDRAKLVLSNKTLRWASEREWRLIAPKRGEARYGRTDCVACVYVGALVNAEHRRALRTSLNGLKIPIFEMQINEYALSFKRILRLPKKK